MAGVPLLSENGTLAAGVASATKGHARTTEEQDPWSISSDIVREDLADTGAD